MTARLPIALVVFLVAFVLLGARAAQAGAVGIQDDDGWKYQPDVAAQRAEKIGADTIRLMVPDNRWRDERSAVVDSVIRAHATGRRVIVSLLAWYSHPTAGEWAAYARDVAGELGPYVDVWSPMNEPNWPGMSPWTGERCVVTSDPSTLQTQARAKARRGWRRVRHGTHRRIVRRSHGRVTVRYRRAHGKRARWKRTSHRGKLVTTVTQSWQDRRDCTAEGQGAAYRRVWDAVAPELRAADPGAALIAGDLCPGPWRPFFDAFGHPDVAPDVVGGHPYGDVARFSAELVGIAADYGVPAWATEWSIPAAWMPDATAADWTGQLATMQQAGIALAVIYDVAGPTWDSRITPDALEAIGA